LPELMAAIDKVPGLWRLRFMTSHPRNATPDLFAAMRELPTVCEQLHLPVQAGDDVLLRRMRRLYTTEHYKDVIAQARDAVPGLSLTTDIIVGFCGETDEEFAGTEQLMRDIRYDTVHLAAYSVRPGTAASRREDDVPLVEKKRRLNHLLALQRDIAEEINATYVGREVEVLVEGRGEDGRVYGRTRQNKTCWLPAEAGEPGQLARGTVTKSTAWQLTVGAATA
ncbi:MAG: radical SAM protein, partial [Trebonia sp.]